MDGGTLVVSEDDLLLGKNGGSATLNMISGAINVNRDFEVGGGDPGIVNMTGGTIIVGDDFMIPEAIASTAQVNLDGGTIIVNGDLNMRADGGTMNGTMNITGGTLIINANALSAVQGYIDNGWITAYDGDGTVALDYNVTNEGQTTLKAVHKLNPNPVNGGLVAPGEVELSWTLPDPCTPGEPVPVDVYFTDDYNALWQFTDPSAEDTSITLSAVGEYVLQLEAFDGKYTSSDIITINVYNNGCEAAQSLPDYVPLPGDLNGDCIVDDLDLAILEEDWLKDTSLTEP